jgi:hypothetical protein
MSHGGLKRSGYSKDLSMYALEDDTAVRHVMIKLSVRCPVACRSLRDHGTRRDGCG